MVTKTQAIKSWVRTLVPAAAMLIPAFSNASPEITGSVYEKCASRYVMGSGSVVSEGAVLQDNLRVNFGRHLGVWGFLNHDLQTSNGPENISPNVVAGGAEVNLPLGKHFTARQDAEYWAYPEEILGKSPDRCFKTSLEYKGPVSLNASYLHFLGTDYKPRIDRFTGTISKPLTLVEKDNVKLSATPYVSAVYQDCHNRQVGWVHKDVGLSACLERGRTSYDLGILRQDGNESLGKKDITVLTAGLKVKF